MMRNLVKPNILLALVRSMKELDPERFNKIKNMPLSKLTMQIEDYVNGRQIRE